MKKSISFIIILNIFIMILFSMDLISDKIFTLIFLPSGIAMLFYGIVEFKKAANSKGH
jgi:hypothetical protein